MWLHSFLCYIRDRRSAGAAYTDARAEMTLLYELAATVGGTTTSYLTAALFLNVCIFGTVLLVRRLKFLYALRKIPSPTALPIIGNALQLHCSLEGELSWDFISSATNALRWR